MIIKSVDLSCGLYIPFLFRPAYKWVRDRSSGSSLINLICIFKFGLWQNFTINDKFQSHPLSETENIGATAVFVWVRS